MTPEQEPVPENPEPSLYTIRNQRVVLDADLARTYGVSTKRFNEAFKRNQERFPEDFAFQVTPEEARLLRSQIATSKVSLVTDIPKDGRGGARYRPWAFTEHGAVMAANILRGNHAVRMSVFVVRAFVQMREQALSNQIILKRIAQIDKNLLQHDGALRDIYRKLLPLLAPPPEPPKRRLGLRKD